MFYFISLMNVLTTPNNCYHVYALVAKYRFILILLLSLPTIELAACSSIL